MGHCGAVSCLLALKMLHRFRSRLRSREAAGSRGRLSESQTHTLPPLNTSPSSHFTLARRVFAPITRHKRAGSLRERGVKSHSPPILAGEGESEPMGNVVLIWQNSTANTDRRPIVCCCWIVWSQAAEVKPSEVCHRPTSGCIFLHKLAFSFWLIPSLSIKSFTSLASGEPALPLWFTYRRNNYYVGVS